MKKLLLSMTLVLAMSLSFTSCRETEKTADEKTIIIKTEEAPKEDPGSLERAGKAIDNATDEVKDAGKAIDDAANEIGNDDN